MTTHKGPPALGIDLGTSTCLACVESDAGELTMIQPDTDYASDVMPSFFCLTEDKGPVVGEKARQLVRDHRYAGDVVRCVKRSMGQRDKLFKSSGTSYSPVDISAHYLRHLKERAEAQLQLGKGKLTVAVVTVPAYFGNLERTLTKEAAEKAGFATVHLLDEPIAAAYGLGLHTKSGRQVAMVVDLGGGTLDVTLLLAGAAVPRGLDELGRDGDAELGGDKWDNELAKLLVFKQELERDADFFEWTNIELYKACELAKCDFCSPDVQKQTIQYWDRVAKKNLAVGVSAQEYRKQTDHLADRCARICDRLLQNIASEDAKRAHHRHGWWRRLWNYTPKLTWQDIDHVYLVGGGCKVPEVKQKIGQLWGRQPQVVEQPQYQVARGAGRIAREVSLNPQYFETMLLRSPFTYGYYYYPHGANGRPEFQPLIQRNARIPVVAKAKCEVGGANASTFAVRIVEERLKLTERTNKPELERRELKTLKILDLPETAGSRECVQFNMKYLSDRETAFSAEFRGKSMTVRLDDVDA